MKKGFTLIELLAVILILGIIALIAIPTVNKIINEAKLSAFKTGMDNIIKTAQTQCQLDLIKNKEPLLNYTFYENEFNYKLDIKGSLPKEGYINLDSNCETTYFYLVDDKLIYKNTEPIEDQMILESSNKEESIFKTLYTSYYDNIDSISFVNNLNIPENAIEIKDVSVSGNGKVKSWLIPDSSIYHLYVGSNDKIYTNYDTKNLFIYNNSSTINLDNLYTDFSYKFYSMFGHMKKINLIDLKQFKTDNAISLDYMFVYSKTLTTIIGLENFNVSNVRNFEGTFNDLSRLSTINLSNWSPNNVVNMHAMFHCATAVNTLDLSNFNVSNAKLLSTLFYTVYNLRTLKLSNWDLPSNVFTNNITFHSNAKLDYIYLDGASDTTINIIANALKNANSNASNRIIYVDEIKSSYPEVPGWTYQQLQTS